MEVTVYRQCNVKTFKKHEGIKVLKIKSKLVIISYILGF